jgi:hypothetical protein
MSKYELDEYPEDKTEKDLETHVAPAVAQHMKNFLSCIESRQKPVSDIEQGYMSAAACILANIFDAARPNHSLGSREGSPSATPKPIACCAAGIAAHGFIRIPQRCTSMRYCGAALAAIVQAGHVRADALPIPGPSATAAGLSCRDPAWYR